MAWRYEETEQRRRFIQSIRGIGIPTPLPVSMTSHRNCGDHRLFRLCPILCLPPASLTYSEVIRVWAQRAPNPHEYYVVTLGETLAKLLICRACNPWAQGVGGSNPLAPTN